ncbi:MAG: homoserine O-acetyltransferase [Rikenellaceae bacterium]
MNNDTIKIYKHHEPFVLESGERLEELQIAYSIYGERNADDSNVVWVCHALTANSDVQDWWPHTVEEGAILDPVDHFVVCANILGSPYGTTAPLHTNPTTGEPYYADFPSYTIRDVVAAHKILAEQLGVGHIDVILGCSVGGFQALEWAVEEPERFSKLILVATDAKATPWSVAINETMRMAIETDPTFGERRDDAAAEGLATARALALLTYRGPHGYNITQQNPDIRIKDHRAQSYQRYQGEKLVKRYNAYSYYAILNAFDTHDVGRGRGGTDAALQCIKAQTYVVGITTDILFPPCEMRDLTSKIPGAMYYEIESLFGHDGFLVEYGQFNRLLRPIMCRS